MLRSEVLKLYKDMLRIARKIPGKQQQNEMIKWIRSDFDLNQHLNDEVGKLLTSFPRN